MLHHNELITIEEDTILGNRSMQRRFTLQNRANELSMSIATSGGSVCSCRCGKQEVVLPATGKDRESFPSSSETGSEWQPHVLGLESLLLTTASQSLSYRLMNNELHLTGKLRQFHALAPFFVNLNSTQSPVDGHFLHVRCASDDPLLAIGDAKFDPMAGISLLTAADEQQTAGLIQDTLFSPDPSAHSLRTNESIIAVLSFQNRSLEVIIQSNGSSIPKLRLRIKRDGVSLMPSQMTDFKCTYKMRW